jgi:hypothetical protein
MKKVIKKLEKPHKFTRPAGLKLNPDVSGH